MHVVTGLLFAACDAPGLEWAMLEPGKDVVPRQQLRFSRVRPTRSVPVPEVLRDSTGSIYRKFAEVAVHQGLPLAAGLSAQQ